MKKIFSLFAAVLFAGSMMAEVKTSTLTFTKACGGTGTADDDVVWTVSSDASESTFDATKGVHYGTGSAAVSYVKISTSQIVGKITKIVVNASGASKTTAKLNVTVGGNAFGTEESLTSTATEYTLEGEASGEIIVSLTHANATQKAIYCKSIAVTYEEDASASVLKANDIKFGPVTIVDPAENYVLDTTLSVIGTNLSQDIIATGSEHITVSGTLTAEGGTLNLHVVAAPGSFSEQVTLTSGETSLQVTVSGKVNKVIVLPGSPATMSVGDNAQEAGVDGVAGVKVGSSKNAGNMTITVPASATKLHLFAAAWTGIAACEVAIAAPEGVTVSPASFEPSADTGISGADPLAYTLNDLTLVECIYDFDLSGVAAETILTLSSTNRFVVWGATYETGGATALDNTAIENKAVKTIENGMIIIEKAGVRYNVLGQIVR